MWKKFKDDEIERLRIAEGKPMKKRKTMLSCFAKLVPVSITPAVSDKVDDISPLMPEEKPLSPEKNLVEVRT